MKVYAPHRDMMRDLDWFAPIRPLADVVLVRGQRTFAEIPAYGVRWENVEWGYGGSGPARLAKSILYYFYGPDAAERYGADFKWALIARLPRDEELYVIPASRIQAVMQMLAEGRHVGG